MNIVLLTVGKTEESYWKEALAEYQRRLQHYVPFELQALPEVKNTKNLTMSQQKTQEGVLIRKAMQAGDWFVLLDEQGKEYTSMQFAAYLEKKIQIVSRRLVFVIGGPYGFSDEVYQMHGFDCAADAGYSWMGHGIWACSACGESDALADGGRLVFTLVLLL